MLFFILDKLMGSVNIFVPDRKWQISQGWLANIKPASKFKKRNRTTFFARCSAFLNFCKVLPLNKAQHYRGDLTDSASLLVQVPLFILLKQAYSKPWRVPSSANSLFSSLPLFESMLSCFMFILCMCECGTRTCVGFSFVKGASKMGTMEETGVWVRGIFL